MFEQLNIPKAKLSESKLQQLILQFLNASGHYAVRVNSGSMLAKYTNKKGVTKTRRIKLAEEGTPDIFTCINGVFVALEVKKDAETVARWSKKVKKFLDYARITFANTTEINQWKQLQRIKKSGGRGYVVSSLSEVQALINSFS